MRCRTCDYPLWNLNSRTCPECGKPFRVVDYEFAPNTVRFCCPKCRLAYYGTGPAGHLEPPEFDCQQCGQSLTIEQMVLLPAEGLDESETRAARVPWLDRRRDGRFKSWLRTVWMAMVNPVGLAKALPLETSLITAWGFAILTAVLTFLVSILPLMVLVGVMPVIAVAMGGGGSGGAAGYSVFVLVVGATLVVGVIVAVVTVILWTLLWGLVAHGLLLLTGTIAGTLRHTYLALLFASGANVATMIPCLGKYVGWLWWMVSGVIMVKDTHQVSGWRASVAVIVPPFTAVAIVGAYMGGIFLMMASPSFASAKAMAGSMQRAASMSSGLQAATAAGGRWPAHGLELVDSDTVVLGDFVIAGTLTTLDDVPAGTSTLGDLMAESATVLREAARDAAAALPADVVAHRVGDFVFTYHGLDPAVTDPRLWTFVVIGDPDVNGPPALDDRVLIGKASGRVETTTYAELDVLLGEQNEYRASFGLPDLPDPADVTHAAPGVERSEPPGR